MQSPSAAKRSEAGISQVGINKFRSCLRKTGIQSGLSYMQFSCVILCAVHLGPPGLVPAAFFFMCVGKPPEYEPRPYNGKVSTSFTLAHGTAWVKGEPSLLPRPKEGEKDLVSDICACTLSWHPPTDQRMGLNQSG